MLTTSQRIQQRLYAGGGDRSQLRLSDATWGPDDAVHLRPRDRAEQDRTKALKYVTLMSREQRREPSHEFAARSTQGTRAA